MTTSRVRSRVRTQWMALGGALVVLAGVLVAWALQRAADRVQVVQIVNQVDAGETITSDDLAVTGIAYDGAVQGLVPVESFDAVAGRVAAIDLQPGALLQVGMWRDSTALAAGERRVGVVLAVGRLPVELGPGDVALAAALDPADPMTSVSARVLDRAVTPEGAVGLTLAVPADAAVDVARLAASEQLVLVGEAPNPSDGGR